MNTLTVIRGIGRDIVDYGRHFHFSVYGNNLAGIAGHPGVPFVVLIGAVSVVLHTFTFFGCLDSRSCSLYGGMV